MTLYYILPIVYLMNFLNHKRQVLYYTSIIYNMVMVLIFLLNLIFGEMILFDSLTFVFDWVETTN